MSRFAAVLIAALLALSVATAAFADGNNPANPGGTDTGATTGYEGQPGNQSH
jgi:hypothetical protein